MSHPITSKEKIWKLVSLNEKKGDTIFTSDKIDVIFSCWIKKYEKTPYGLLGELIDINDSNESSNRGVVYLNKTILCVTNMWRSLDYDLFITVNFMSTSIGEQVLSIIEMLDFDFEKDWSFFPRLMEGNTLIAVDVQMYNQSKNFNKL